ncbi:hypothetical protein SDRG_06559 [Saprolegnia diclina VS20]|uniref:Major facilitator superfamily (MFS) profile domain-containing protein n=1 Tax=Saprolegnia diclina (strain VS20) TaxID=1156394 RepID=T0QPM3_SAPDV|nr:hypothetical protein SDRG_06559 [Saprolegnia diclina VS20]EQC35800.1 hypothetical protein SDRG_06559 [Saprolegnia diclina VS20]|eukprot:XP_008610562.1 hypothetical protein SDRG_06559 [Saprolegnia diclina VS20]
MGSWLETYWSITLRPKTLDEIGAERWLVAWPGHCVCHCVRFRRIYVALASCVAQACAGILFAMVVVAEPMADYVLGPASLPDASVTLTQCAVAYCIPVALLSPELERRGPRWSMLLGSVLVLGGYAVLGLAILIRVWVLAHVGLFFSSLGLGCIQVTSMATSQKWAPDLRGTMSGLCNVGFGLGQLLWVRYFGWLLKHVPTEYLFWCVLPVLLPLLLACTIVLRTPPPDFTAHGHDMHGIPAHKSVPAEVHDEYFKVGMTLVNVEIVAESTTGLDGTLRQYHEQVKALSLLQCVFSTDFFCLCVAFVAISMLNLPYFPLAAPDTATWASTYNRTKDEASSLVTYGGASGLLGRLVVPMISDVIVRVFYANPAFARKAVFTALLVAAVIALPIFADNFDETVPTMIYLTRLLSGAGASLVTCFATDMYGVINTGVMYGFTFSIYLAVADFVGPMVAHGVGAHDLRVFWVLALLGLVLMLFVRTESADRFYHGYRLTICKKVVVQIPFRNSAKDPPVSARGSFFIYGSDSDDDLFIKVPMQS